jgi:hypothetical protein
LRTLRRTQGGIDGILGHSQRRKQKN